MRIKAPDGRRWSTRRARSVSPAPTIGLAWRAGVDLSLWTSAPEAMLVDRSGSDRLRRMLAALGCSGA